MINTINIPLAIKGAAFCGLTLMAGCADANRGFDDRDMDRFVAAMISVDCRVDAKSAAVVEKTTGFSDAKLTKITDYLKEKTLITKTENTAGIILINEGCP